MRFWHMRLSCPDTVTPWFTTLLDQCVYNPIVHQRTFTNIPWHLKEANSNDFVIIHIGGDVAKKRRYESLPQFGQSYTNANYAIGKILAIDETQKSLTCKLFPFPYKTRSDLYRFPIFLDNIGPMTKGQATQAGLHPFTPNHFDNDEAIRTLISLLQDDQRWEATLRKEFDQHIVSVFPDLVTQQTQADTLTLAPILLPLKNYKAIILEGVPGTGKTYSIQNIVRHWKAYTNRSVKGTASGNYAITMHPNTSYEDFVEGLRPNGSSKTTGQYFHTPTKAKKEKKNEGFSYQDGFFKRICKEAAQDPDNDYLVLLDEFNRCNIPKVMGDLLTTLESSKRVPVADIVKDGLSKAHQTITLPYSKEKFFVPDNVYVIGTMNTTDRSVVPMDSALRRRFAFIRVWPMGFDPKNPTSSDAISKMIVSTLLSDCAQSYLHQSIQLYFAINTKLQKHGPDVLLGHSYLYDLKRFLKDITDDKDGWSTTKMVWDQSIFPYLVDSLRKNNLLKLLDEHADLWEVLHEHVAIINQGKGFQRLPTLLLSLLPKIANDIEEESSSSEGSHDSNKPN